MSVAYLIKPKEKKYWELLCKPYLDGYIYPLKFTGKKMTIAQAKDQYENELHDLLVKDKIKYIICCDAEFYKALVAKAKPSVEIGTIKTTKDGAFKITYCPSPLSSFYNPDDFKHKFKLAYTAVQKHMAGTYSDPGQGIITTGIYPKTPLEIKEALNNLHKHRKLTCDIETFSLKFYEAGLGSIAFAWNEHEGIAFKIDNSPTEENTEVRNLLKEFIETYRGKLIFHNIAYDATVLIYQLWMNSLHDTMGQLEGLGYMLSNFEDTMIITYLATNSASGNELGLKAQSFEFAGNYAQENINDITKIPEDDLLKYNLTDVLSTWFVYNKHVGTMLRDNQGRVYGFFKKILSNIIQMQLNGIPIDMKQAKKVAKQLEQDEQDALRRIHSNKYVAEFTSKLRSKAMTKYNLTHKKQKTLLDFRDVFNPNSPLQKAELLYKDLKLPVVDTTDTNQPATGNETLKKLISRTNDQDIKDLLQAFIDYVDVVKINTTFMPNFLSCPYDEELKWHFLFGSLHLGGTVSGRLSSSSPNLQQLPSTGSKYANAIKSFIKAPPGWVYCGLDYASLEDHVSALLTKDPNKLAVYTDGYDGHCLRAYSYFKDKMPDITAQLDEIKKEGKIFKVTHDDGSVEFLNENNPKLKEILNESIKCN